MISAIPASPRCLTLIEPSQMIHHLLQRRPTRHEQLIHRLSMYIHTCDVAIEEMTCGVTQVCDQRLTIGFGDVRVTYGGDTHGVDQFGDALTGRQVRCHQHSTRLHVSLTPCSSTHP